MKESESKEPKMVYLLPNLMTAGNLCFGFFAILNIFEGTIRRTNEDGDWIHYYQFSLFCILGAFVCDMLDGRMARLSGQESPFGREFDSLADIVSFGIAPALLVFKIVLFEFENRLGWPIAFVYLACGALRLARFNVLAAMPDKKVLKEFTGFPIPAAAGLIASITLLLLHVYQQDRIIGNWKYLLAALMLFLSYMMFSKFRYPSFKSLNWRAQMSVPKLFLFCAGVALTIIFYRYSLAVLFTGYLFYGFLRPYISKSWREDLGDEEDDEFKPSS
ncbi:MAG: CDP-diacylglycerol--serine O-phosphatidyltransferase [Verrucomicrobiales bacterium]|jgi:CDP-diacylglycerol--serine O-phosphatidyltransferase|nr:CDP-diacylglycerol--serine O-phosphatidyltransferase [Verrucomicrobiales bacterium]